MSIFNYFIHKDILTIVEKKNKLIRYIIYFISCFMVALSYNVFFVKNNLVIGGMSGLAIVVKKAFNMNTSLFLISMTIILLFVSNILLEKKETKKNILGAVLFPIFVILTEPVSNCINLNFNSYLFTTILASFIYGTFLGIIYKIGYSTGGGDIINQIICKYAHTSIGQAGNYFNILIIFTSIFVFGFSQSFYAIFSLILVNTIVDFIVLGNCDSKLCIIKTKKVEYLEDFLKNDFNIGYSILESNAGTETKKRKTILCAVTSREYYKFKNLILDIDPHAFFVTHNCYEVLGGINKRFLN